MQGIDLIKAINNLSPFFYCMDTPPWCTKIGVIFKWPLGRR
jgi:hypothetical protein